METTTTRMRVDYKIIAGADKLAVEEHNNTFGALTVIVRCPNGRYMIASWNPYHANWTRTNRDKGGAVHRSLKTIATDNLGGGPCYMTLREARALLEDAGMAAASGKGE